MTTTDTDQAADDHLDPPRPGPGRINLGAAGGRGRTLWRRRALWLLVALLAAGSVRGLLLQPAGPPSTDRLAGAVAAKLGQTAFPSQRADQWAVRFTIAYLTFDQAHPDAHAAELARYTTDAALQQDPQLGWDGKGKQWVFNAYPAGRQILDDHHAVITVEAWLTDARWLRLAVPVKADRDGRLAVTGRPASVDIVGKADADPADITDADAELDSAVTAELARLLPAFFAAYAASSDNLATPTGTVLAGLGGTVKFVQFNNLRVPVGGDHRTATVDVTWQTGNARLTQPYQLQIVHRDRWLIAAIQVAH